MSDEYVWLPVHDDEANAFLLAKRVSAEEIELVATGEVVAVPEPGLRKFGRKATVSTALIPVAVPGNLGRDYPDLVSLDELTHPLVLHHLAQRFSSNKIYTFVGDIVIAINPYQRLPLYEPEHIQEYMSAKQGAAPHVFKTSDNAYRDLVESGNKQSLVISGESGAGKTEATKQCLRYLSACAGSEANVDKKILQSNPILEAFGNAKTKRNNNSSRFGKYVQIFFDDQHQIVGAKNTNYLLEKVRVTSQAEGERNYHVLYQLLRGASDDQLHRYGLSGIQVEDMKYLNQSGCVHVDNVDDAEEFAEMERAFADLGIATEQVFAVVAIVLHLGNIEFVDIGDRECKMQEPGSGYDPVHWASQLLGVARESLGEALEKTTFQSARRGSASTKMGVNAQTAESMRDSLSRYLYSQLFDWLVLTINRAIAVDDGQEDDDQDIEFDPDVPFDPAALDKASAVSKHHLGCIGVLDIFGFEVFEENSFEQLCINFTNEMLQLLFTTSTLSIQLALYAEQEIDFSSVVFTDNQESVDLICKKRTGIFPILEECLKMPTASDKMFLENLITQHASSTNVFKEVMKRPANFIVMHYAGEVEYDSAGFIDKNRDVISLDLSMLITGESTNAFLTTIIADGNDSTLSQTMSNKKAMSLGTQFVMQVESLVENLKTTVPHYIRCVKPNTNKLPGQFNGRLVVEQLENSGVFAVLNIRKQGFPYQQSYAEFVEAYRIINLDVQSSTREDVENLLQHMGITNNVQVGKSIVFCRSEEHQAMMALRLQKYNEILPRIQARMRGTVVRRLMNKWNKIFLLPITKALDDNNADELKAILKAWGSTDRLDLRLLAEARTRLITILTLEKKIEYLQSVPLTDDTEEEYMHTVEDIRAIEYSSELSEIICERYDTLLLKRKCIVDLGVAMEAMDRTGLGEAITLAESLGLANDVLDKAVRMKQQLDLELQYSQELTQECSAGYPTSILDSINVTELQTLVLKTKELFPATKECKRILRLSTNVLELRTLLSTALGTVSSPAWKDVLSMATRLLGEDGHDSIKQELDTAVRVAHAALEASKIDAALVAATTSRSLSEIKKILGQAEEISLRSLSSNVASAEHAVEQIEKALGLLNDAIDSLDEMSLEEAINFAAGVGFTQLPLPVAKDLLDKISRWNRQVEAALDSKDLELIRLCKGEGDVIGLSEKNSMLYEELEMFIKAMEELGGKLSVAVEHKHLKKLAMHISRARKVGFTGASLDKAVALESDLRQWSEAMEAALASKALDEVERLRDQAVKGVTDDNSDAYKASSEYLTLMDTCETELRDAMKDCNVESIELVLRKCYDLGYSRGLLEEAQEKVKNLTEWSKDVDESLGKCDEAQINGLYLQAGALGLTKENSTQLTRLSKFSEDMKHCSASLSDAVKSLDYRRMKDVLGVAKHIGESGDIVVECNRVLETVLQWNTTAQGVLENTQYEELEKVWNSAVELGLTKTNNDILGKISGVRDKIANMESTLLTSIEDGGVEVLQSGISLALELQISSPTLELVRGTLDQVLDWENTVSEQLLVMNHDTLEHLLLTGKELKLTKDNSKGMVHLYEYMDEFKEVAGTLESALESRDMDELTAGIQLADKLGFNGSALDSCVDMLTVLVKWCAAVNLALESQQYLSLKQLKAEAEELGLNLLNNQLMPQLTHYFADVHQVVSKLSRAMVGKDCVELQQSIDAAEELGYDDEALHKAVKLLNELEMWEADAKTVLDKRETWRVVDVYERGSVDLALGVTSQLLSDLSMFATEVSTVEQKMHHADDSRDVEEIEDALRQAVEFGYTGPKYDALASVLVNLQKWKIRAVAVLATSLPKAAVVEELLSSGEQLRLNPLNCSLMGELDEINAGFLVCGDMLETALTEMHLDDLTRAIEYCTAKGYSGALLIKASETLVKVQRWNERARHKTNDLVQLQALITQGEAIGLTAVNSEQLASLQRIASDIGECERRLEDSMRSMDTFDMEQAIEFATSMGYSGRKLRRCQVALDKNNKFAGVRNDLLDAIDARDEARIQQAISAARAAGFRGEELAEATKTMEALRAGPLPPVGGFYSNWDEQPQQQSPPQRRASFFNRSDTFTRSGSMFSMDFNPPPPDMSPYPMEGFQEMRPMFPTEFNPPPPDMSTYPMEGIQERRGSFRLPPPGPMMEEGMDDEMDYFDLDEEIPGPPPMEYESRVLEEDTEVCSWSIMGFTLGCTRLRRPWQ